MTVYDPKLEIELLKKDVSALTTLMTKIDATMEKVQEIAQNLSKMLSLQEQRLNSQEKLSNEMYLILEARRVEHDTAIKEVHKTVEDVEMKILDELEKIRDDNDEHRENMNKKISRLEIWRYSIIGGLAVLTYLITETEILKKIIS